MHNDFRLPDVLFEAVVRGCRRLLVFTDGEVDLHIDGLVVRGAGGDIGFRIDAGRFDRKADRRSLRFKFFRRDGRARGTSSAEQGDQDHQCKQACVYRSFQWYTSYQ